MPTWQDRISINLALVVTSSHTTLWPTSCSGIRKGKSILLWGSAWGFPEPRLEVHSMTMTQLLRASS